MSGDSSELLELVEEALNAVAPAISFFVVEEFFAAGASEAVIEGPRGYPVNDPARRLMEIAERLRDPGQERRL